MKALNLSGQLKNFLRNEPAKETIGLCWLKKKVFKDQFEFRRFAVVNENFWCKIYLWKYAKIPPAC